MNTSTRNIENQLWNYLQQIKNHIPNFLKHDSLKQDEIISKTFMEIFNRHTSTRIDLNHFEEFQGYIFIALKNAINQAFIKNNFQKLKVDSDKFEQDSFNNLFTSTQTNEPHFKMQQEALFRLLTPDEIKLLNQRIEGFKMSETCLIMNITLASYQSLLRSIKAKAKHVFNVDEKMINFKPSDNFERIAYNHKHNQKSKNNKAYGQLLQPKGILFKD